MMDEAKDAAGRIWKIATVATSIEKLSEDMKTLSDDLDSQKDFSIETLALAKRNQERAIDFRQNSSAESSRQDNEIRALREQVATLTATVDRLSAELKLSQETAKLREKLQLEKMKTMSNELFNQMLSRFFTQAPRTDLQGATDSPVLPSSPSDNPTA